MPRHRAPRVRLVREVGSGMDWDEALRLHEEQGLSYVAIARRFGYSAKTVRGVLSARGAHPHPLRLRGAADRTLHRLWASMRAKCHRPSHASYPKFGARGVVVCIEWRRSFDAFRDWARASGWRPGLRIVRRRSSRGFGPGNCAWVTAREEITSRALGRPRAGASGKGKPKARIDWHEAVRLYRDEGVSRREIARRYGAHPSAIDAGMRRRRVKRERRPAPTASPEGYRLHKTWIRLHRMCRDPEHRAYRYYGGRGVRVARAWARFEPFLEWALATGAGPNLCLTRLDRRKGYSPENCTWVTRREAFRRRARPGPVEGRLHITAWDETKSLASWSRDPRCKVTRTTITKRLAAGLVPEHAIGDPPLTSGTRHVRFTGIRAFGCVRGLAEWARDSRCRVSVSALTNRLARGWRPEAAIATPPYEQPREGARAQTRGRPSGRRDAPRDTPRGVPRDGRPKQAGRGTRRARRT